MHNIHMYHYKCLACESKMSSILNSIVGNSVGCPLSCPRSCPLYPYMEVVGSQICMAKFPWAATPLPTVSIYGSSGQPNLHGKIPMGTHGQPTPLPTCSPWVVKWAAPLFFSVWGIRNYIQVINCIELFTRLFG